MLKKLVALIKRLFKKQEYTYKTIESKTGNVYNINGTIKLNNTQKIKIYSFGIDLITNNILKEHSSYVYGEKTKDKLEVEFNNNGEIIFFSKKPIQNDIYYFTVTYIQGDNNQIISTKELIK